MLKAALALTMWGSKVRLISTHNGIENLFTIITDSRAGKNGTPFTVLISSWPSAKGCIVVSVR